MAPFIGTGVRIGSGVLMSAAASTPEAYANLKFWLHSSDLAVGVNASWADRSGQGNNATGVGSPVASDGWGGKRMLTLNGSSQYLTANAVAAIASGTSKPVSVAVTYQLTADDAAYYGLWAFNNAVGQQKLELAKNNTTGGAWLQSNQGDVAPIVNLSAGASVTTKRVFVMSHTGSAVKTWFNGALTHNAASACALRTLDLFSIGVLRRAGATNFYTPVNLTEFLVWDTALSDAQAAAQTVRMTAEWGV